MILRDSLFWRNVAEHSFLLIIVSAHSLASLLFLLSDEFFDSKLQKKGVFQQTVSRSSLHYRKKPRGSRANRTYNEQILMTCGEKLAYGYRRVTWWLQRKKGLPV